MSSKWLNSCRSNTYSQNGEDGVLEAIFSRIGETSRWCCELGAWDGVHLSNTRRLVEQGWKALLIESDADKYESLCRNLKGLSITRREEVKDLDSVLRRFEIPYDFDLLSLDVDGPDYWLWERTVEYRPRVVVIEVNSGFPPDQEEVPGSRGASLKSMVLLGKQKGYELVLHTGNAIFVRRELASLLDVDPDNWQELFDDSWT